MQSVCDLYADADTDHQLFYSIFMKRELTDFIKQPVYHTKKRVSYQSLILPVEMAVIAPWQ